MAEAAGTNERHPEYLEYLNGINPDNEVTTDESLKQNDEKHIKDHNQQYTELLKCYVDNISKTLRIKYRFKVVFFSFIMISIVAVFCVFLKSVNYALECGEISTAVPAVIGGFVSLISATIVLPSIIAKYLFNLDEEKDALEIIRKMQDFDKTLRKKK